MVVHITITLRKLPACTSFPSALPSLPSLRRPTCHPRAWWPCWQRPLQRHHRNTPSCSRGTWRESIRAEISPGAVKPKSFSFISNFREKYWFEYTTWEKFMLHFSRFPITLPETHSRTRHRLRENWSRITTRAKHVSCAAQVLEESPED